MRAEFEQRRRDTEQLRISAERKLADLREAEILLDQERGELQEQRVRFEGWRTDLQHQLAAAQQESEQKWREAETLWTQRCKAVEERAERLDERESELEALGERVWEAQREALETRLATEELWSQLAGPIPPAALTRSIGRLRNRIADHFRLASAELEDQKQELALLHGRLQQRGERLAEQRRDIQQWVTRRNAELVDQAEQIALREEEFERRQADFEDREQGRRDGRSDLQRRLRELLEQSTPRQPSCEPVA